MKIEYEVREKVGQNWQCIAFMPDKEAALREFKWFKKTFTHRTFRLVKIETIV